MDDRRGLRNGDGSEYGSTRAGGHCGGAAVGAIQPRFSYWLNQRDFDGCPLTGCSRDAVLYGILLDATVVAGEQTRASLYHGRCCDGGGGNGGGGCGGDGTTDCV